MKNNFFFTAKFRRFVAGELKSDAVMVVFTLIFGLILGQFFSFGGFANLGDFLHKDASLLGPFYHYYFYSLFSSIVLFNVINAAKFSSKSYLPYYYSIPLSASSKVLYDVFSSCILIPVAHFILFEVYFSAASNFDALFGITDRLDIFSWHKLSAASKAIALSFPLIPLVRILPARTAWYFLFLISLWQLSKGLPFLYRKLWLGSSSSRKIPSFLELPADFTNTLLLLCLFLAGVGMNYYLFKERQIKS